MFKEIDPSDAHTYRVYLRHTGTDAVSSQEVIALYHQFENDFIVFKDAAHAAVLTLAAASVLEIQRLRTHALLAVSRDELSMVTRALRDLSGRLLENPRDSITADEGKGFALLADSLDRLNPVAETRDREDRSSLPRTWVGQPTTTAPAGHAVVYNVETQAA